MASPLGQGGTSGGFEGRNKPTPALRATPPKEGIFRRGRNAASPLAYASGWSRCPPCHILRCVCTNPLADPCGLNNRCFRNVGASVRSPALKS